jgi:hypothetical protein
MAKAKTAKEIPLESFVIEFQGQPAMEVKWLSDVVFAAIAEGVNWWVKEAEEIRQDRLQDAASIGSEAAHDYDLKLATCPLHTQSPQKALEHLRDTFPRAIHDLLQLLVEEAYWFIGTDFDHKCRLPDHRRLHTIEDKYVIGLLENMQRRSLEERLNLPLRERRGGNKGRLINTDQAFKLAKEAAKLRTDQSYGDDRNKTLWGIICYRYDNNDPKWRERAKLDHEDVPDVVLDLVPQRKKFKLKASHLALYHASVRAGITFAITTRAANKKPFIQPSPATLLRRCNEVSVRTQTHKRKRGSATRTELLV